MAQWLVKEQHIQTPCNSVVMKGSSWTVHGLENVKQMEHGVVIQRNVKVSIHICHFFTTFNTALHICQVISISLTRIGYEQRPLELLHPSRSTQHLGWRLHYGTKTSHYLHSKEHFSFS